MKLIIRFESPALHWAPHYIFNRIYQLLKETNVQVEYVPTQHLIHQIGIDNPHTMYITNPINKKTIVLTYMDNPYNVLSPVELTGWNPSNIVQLFCVSDFKLLMDDSDLFKEKYNIDVKTVVTPFSYPVYDSIIDLSWSDELYNSLAPINSRKEKLLFRGMLYNDRKYVAENVSHPEITCAGDCINRRAYVEELVQYKCGLSFNGVAEICNRDMELMSLGIPILRPSLKTTSFYDPLIENVHYISYDFNRNADHKSLQFPEDDNYKLILDALISRWEQIKKDNEFLSFVANNAKNWYNKNGKLEQQAILFLKLMNLNLLRD